MSTELQAFQAWLMELGIEFNTLDWNTRVTYKVQYDLRPQSSSTSRPVLRGIHRTKFSYDL
jgi:hypothetical protein